MGTLLGHLTPALLIYSTGLYCAVMVSRALSRGQKLLFLPLPPKDKQDQRSGVILISGEFFFLPGANHFLPVDWEDPRRPFQHHREWQHATIIAFFLLSALVDLMRQAQLAHLGPCVVVLEMVALIERRITLEFRAHAKLMLPAFLLALMLPIWAPDQPPFWVLKAWLMLMSGSWLLVVTLMLHAPLSLQPWQADSPVDLASVTTFFCWLLGLGVVMLAIVYGLCSLWHHCCSSWKRAPGAGYQPCPLGEDSEELEQFRAKAGLEGGK
uniref:Uncharacterized protein n=1 Tax=Moschus moschiferus TaxID=68415 RepID=A0A8C6DDE6_MOSMO